MWTCLYGFVLDILCVKHIICTLNCDMCNMSKFSIFSIIPSQNKIFRFTNSEFRPLDTKFRPKSPKFRRYTLEFRFLIQIPSPFGNSEIRRNFGRNFVSGKRRDSEKKRKGKPWPRMPFFPFLARRESMAGAGAHAMSRVRRWPMAPCRHGGRALPSRQIPGSLAFCLGVRNRWCHGAGGNQPGRRVNNFGEISPKFRKFFRFR